MASKFMALVIGLTILDGCKFASASKVKHDFGEIANAGDLMISCKPEQSPSSPEDAEALQYLKDHIKRLVDANRSVLPQGIENVCPVIDATYMINASAAAEGVVTLNRGFLWLVSNDAQVAAVIAHELSHTASLHSIGGRAKGNIVNDKDYQETQAKLRAIYPEITTGKGLQINTSFASLYETLMNTVANNDTQQKLARQYMELLWPFLDRTVNQFDLFMTKSSDKIVPVIQQMPVDNANREAAWKYRADEIKFKGYEDIFRMVASHRLLLLEGMQESQRAAFLRDEAAAISDGERFLTSSNEYKNLRLQLNAIEEKYMVKDVAANWKEQEADEKGLELFIRAGYDPKEYAQMFARLERIDTESEKGQVPVAMRRSVAGKQLEPLASATSCHIADRVDTNKCERGSSTHPSSCWREQNVYDELKKHEADYASLLPKAKGQNVFGGKLARLQSYYFTTVMQSGSPTAAKASGSCVDVQPDRDTCADKKAWGQCNETWMRSHNWCQCTCGY